MDYEKEYKEALERARELSKSITGAFYDVIFPELKDSEDERIRKELIENFKWFCGDFPETTKWGKDDNLFVKDIIAWLEKQEEKPQGKTALDAINEEIVDNANKADSIKLTESEDERIRKWLIAQLQIKIGDNATLNDMIYKAIAWLEKQGKLLKERVK